MFTLRLRWIRRTGFLVGLLCTLSLLLSISTVAADLDDEPFTAPGILSSPGHIEQPSSLTTPPQKAYELLKRIQDRGGVPLPGYIGGRHFQNRERRLPRGYYREYDVNPKLRGRGRDAERLVIEQRTGKSYYTGDHYRTFMPLN